MSSRREFVAATSAALATLAGAACGGGSEPTAPGSADVRIALPAVGETAGVAPRAGASSGIAVTRLTDTSVVAVSRTCTHQGCTVGLPATPLANMLCPCHGSVYTVSGAVVSGPAPRALPAFPARIDGTDVVVTVG